MQNFPNQALKPCSLRWKRNPDPWTAGTSQNAAVHVQQQGVHLSSRDLLGEHRVIPVFSVSLFKKRLLWWLNGKESACNAGDAGLIPGLGRSPGGWHGNPL